MMRWHRYVAYLRKTQHALLAGAGFLLISLMSAYAFGRFHGGM